MIILPNSFQNTIKHTFVHEGFATYVMYLDFWKGLGSSMLSKYTIILASFDGPSIRLHHVLPWLLVQFWGNTMSAKVEMADAALDYNILLGWKWIYAMMDIISSSFCFMWFHYEYRIVTIDQLSFDNLGSSASSVHII